MDAIKIIILNFNDAKLKSTTISWVSVTNRVASVDIKSFKSHSYNL